MIHTIKKKERKKKDRHESDPTSRFQSHKCMCVYASPLNADHRICILQADDELVHYILSDHILP